MIAAGIVDPTKVTRSALENAASVAEMVLTTESLVADLPEPPHLPAVTWAVCTNPYQSFLIRYAREVEFLFGEVPPLFMYTPHLCCPP